MTCERVRDLLDDYLDGELPAETAVPLRGHLEGCAACAEEERALRSLLAEAAALPREIAPARELWSGIAPRLVPPKLLAFPSRRASFVPGALAAAAAVLVALSVFWTWRSAPDGSQVRTAAVPGASASGIGAPAANDSPSSSGSATANDSASGIVTSPVAAASSGAASPSAAASTLLPAAAVGGAPGLLESEREYARATQELLAAIEARRATLPPDTLQAIEKNMQLIDQALASLRAAIESAPANRDLEQLLATTHKRKLETLRRVTRLSRI